MGDPVNSSVKVGEYLTAGNIVREQIPYTQLAAKTFAADYVNAKEKVNPKFEKWAFNPDQITPLTKEGKALYTYVAEADAKGVRYTETVDLHVETIGGALYLVEDIDLKKSTDGNKTQTGMCHIHKVYSLDSNGGGTLVKNTMTEN